MPLTFGSLFSGIGAFDLGLTRAGWSCRFQVEKEADCRRVLARHWPDVPRRDDVRTSGADSLTSVDLVVGGFPCQDLSVAGRRGGLEGERSGLWWEMLRVIRELRPRLVLWENVPGLFSSDSGRDLLRVCCSLAEHGYRGLVRTLDAQFFGVPQRRRRLFGLFARLDPGDGGGLAGTSPWSDEGRLLGLLGQVLLEPEGMPGHPSEGGGEGEGTAGGTESGVGIPYELQRGGEGLRGIIGRTAGDTPAVDRHGTDPVRNQGGLVVAVPILEAGARTGASTTDPRAGLGIGEDGDPMYTLQAGKQHAVAFSPQAGGKQTSLGYDPESPTTGTVVGDQTPAVHIPHAMTVRRLTPVECARLQGLPSDWLDLDLPLSDSAKYRMIGNAGAVPVLEWIGRRLIEALGLENHP